MTRIVICWLIRPERRVIPVIIPVTSRKVGALVVTIASTPVAVLGKPEKQFAVKQVLDSAMIREKAGCRKKFPPEDPRESGL